MKLFKLVSFALALLIVNSLAFAEECVPPPGLLFCDSDLIQPIPGIDGGNIDVGGIGDGWEDKIFAKWGDPVQRPGLQQLEDASKEFVANQLGVEVGQAFLHAARGQIKALVFIRLMDIVNKPATDRTADEQLVYSEFQELIRSRRSEIAMIAKQEWTEWYNSPCSYQLPVGDNPNAYLEQDATISYCLNQEFGNFLPSLVTVPTAISSANYLNWAFQLRNKALMDSWIENYCLWGCDDPAVRESTESDFSKSLSDSYIETEQAMAYHQAMGTLLTIPGFDSDFSLADGQTLASGMQDVLTSFGANYVRDFIGTILLTTIVTGPGGLVPDIHDLVIIATLIAANTTLEIVDHVNSQAGIDDAIAQSNESLESIARSNKGRAELFISLLELSAPDTLRTIGLPSHDNLLPGVFYSSDTPDQDTVALQDWGRSYQLEAFNNTATFGYSDQFLLSRTGGLSDYLYNGFTSNIRYIDDKGDFKTAWLVKSSNGGRQLMITHYAEQIKDASGVPARVSVRRLFNSDCPEAGTYPFGSEPTDHGLSCVESVSTNGVPITTNLSVGDGVIINGQVATVKEIISANAFSTTKPLSSGAIYMPLHKIGLSGGTQIPVNSFVYGVNGGASTAILDLASPPPVITIDSPDLTVEAYAVNNVVDLGNVSATDFVDGTVSVSSDAPAGFPLGTTIVTYTATDSGGNTAIATQSVNVVDTVAPEFDLYPSVPIGDTGLRLLPAVEQKNAEATGILTEVILDDLTASDIFGVISVSNNAPENGFPVGFTTVIWTATDANGNSTQLYQTVYVHDTTAPVFTFVPAAINVEATSPLTEVVLGEAIASDIFSVTISNDAPAGGFSIGINVVTWTATDANGNTATVTQNVTIVDTTPPVFTFVPAEINTEATGPLTDVVLGAATATDIFAVTISNDVPANGFSPGAHIVTWTATDTNGNSTTATQTVTVVDTTPPAISITEVVISVEATAVETVVNLGDVTATDLVDGNVSVSSDAPVAFPLGDTIVTYTATDLTGNISTASQTVTVVDTTAPVFTALPVDIDLIARGELSNVDLGQVLASDIFPVSITNDAPAVFPVGTTLVTWTITDTSGNSAATTQKVTFSYQFEGFMKPIENGGIYKINRILPLRFQLTYADGSVASTAQAALSVYQLSNGEINGDSLEISSVSNADSGSNFRVVNNQYVYNLNTRDTDKGIYRLLVMLNDGKNYSIDIALK